MAFLSPGSSTEAAPMEMLVMKFVAFSSSALLVTGNFVIVLAKAPEVDFNYAGVWPTTLRLKTNYAFATVAAGGVAEANASI